VGAAAVGLAAVGGAVVAVIAVHIVARLANAPEAAIVGGAR